MRKIALLLLFTLMCAKSAMAWEKDHFSLSSRFKSNLEIVITYLSKPTADQAIQYSTDKTNWSKLLPDGSLGENSCKFTFWTTELYYFRKGDAEEPVRIMISSYGDKLLPIKAEGNVMSLIDRNFNNEKRLTKVPDQAFKGLFAGCKTLFDAHWLFLPTDTLGKECYANMFADCSLLETAPELPAMTLAEDCYMGMFSGCVRLISCPRLPAAELATGCYSMMFMGCNRVQNASNLPATTLAPYCYSNMFAECSSLKHIPDILPATTLENGCYNNMFRGCGNIETAPELPAKTLVYDCYKNMFGDCYKLKTVKLGATEGFDTAGCLASWLENAGTHGEGIVYTDETMTERAGELNLPSYWIDDKCKIVLNAYKDNTDPEFYNTYFTTFFDNHEFTLGDGAVAFIGTISQTTNPQTGKVVESKMIMKPVEGNVIPKGEAVIIRSSTPTVNLTFTQTNAEKSADNVLQGTHTETPAPSNCYIFTRGQKHVGFYQYAEGKALTPQKAYLVLNADGTTGTRALKMEF